jgi:hypothetical protein
MRLFDSAIGKTISTRPKRYRALSSRVGVFPYVIDGKLLWQYRPEDEVYSDESIESFLDASITIGHPENDTELENQHGTIYDVEVDRESDEPGVYCDFLVFTDESRELASSGIPVSPSYESLILDKQGEYKGRKYDLIQTKIRYRSLGLVPDARQEKTKVFYQLSKDGSLYVNQNIIEVPIVKTKIAPLQLDVELNIKPAETEETIINSDENQTEITDATDTETPETEEQPPVESVTQETETEGESGVAVINSDGGVNINKDYLDESIDVARRAESMGLLSFNEALMYSLSSQNTIKRMILLKDGVEITEWEDIGAAYKVYKAMKPMGNMMTNSDSRPTTPILPKINHPIHQSKTPTYQGYETAKVVYFDDFRQ